MKINMLINWWSTFSSSKSTCSSTIDQQVFFRVSSKSTCWSTVDQQVDFRREQGARGGLVPCQAGWIGTRSSQGPCQAASSRMGLEGWIGMGLGWWGEVEGRVRAAQPGMSIFSACSTFYWAISVTSFRVGWKGVGLARALLLDRSC